MSTGRRPPGYMTEDLEMREVSGPLRYTSRTNKPVEHITLATQEGEHIGDIYANDEDEAAGWQAVAGASPDAQNLAAPWMRMLLDAKMRGLKPSAALDELIRTGKDHPTDPRSHVVANSRTSTASLKALKELAER